MDYQSTMATRRLTVPTIPTSVVPTSRREPSSSTFTIENTGGQPLTLTGVPFVAVSGTHAVNFSVTLQPSPPIASGGGTTTFTVRFDPTAVGLRSAQISIDTNDNDERTYTFAIQGTGTAGPEIDVQGNGTSIADGSDAAPAMIDDTDFGTADIAASTADHTFTIHNTGSDNLILPATPVAIGGTHAVDFSVTAQPSSPVAPGGTTTFTVRFNPSTTGLRSATIAIANDDSDENPYNFSIQGTGVIAPEIDVIGNGKVITDGDTTPGASDHTDFESADVTVGTVDRTFTVQNSGSANLSLNGAPLVDLSGANAADFSVTAEPTSPVAASGGNYYIHGCASIPVPPVSGRQRFRLPTMTATRAPTPFNIQGTGYRCSSGNGGTGQWERY